MLDGLTLALRNVDCVSIGRLPRMADFAKWAAAGLPALGFTTNEFIEAYRLNREEAVQIGLEASPVGHAILAFMNDCEKWTGTANALLDQLSGLGGDDKTQSKAWPRSAKGLINTLRRLAPSLRRMGITWEDERKNDVRLHTLCRVGFKASQASQVSQTQSQKGFLADSQASPKRHLSVTQASQASRRNSKRHTQPIDNKESVTDVTLVTLKNPSCTPRTDGEVF